MSGVHGPLARPQPEWIIRQKLQIRRETWLVTLRALTGHPCSAPTRQLAHHARPHRTHLRRPLRPQDLSERIHHREVEPIEHLRLDTKPDMVHPLDLDQV